MAEKRKASTKIVTPFRVDPSFRPEIMGAPGGETLKACFQCGTCTSSCPIARFSGSYRPRQIIQMTQLGMRSKVLSSDTLWLCAGCYTCYERCPEEVRVSEIVSALRKLALKEGIIHPTFKTLMRSIAEMGYIYEIDDFQNEMREDEDLPLAPEPDAKEIETIMRKTGFLDLVEGG